jgi:hypothetical protein
MYTTTELHIIARTGALKEWHFEVTEIVMIKNLILVVVNGTKIQKKIFTYPLNHLHDTKTLVLIGMEYAGGDQDTDAHVLAFSPQPGQMPPLDAT